MPGIAGSATAPRGTEAPMSALPTRRGCPGARAALAVAAAWLLASVAARADEWSVTPRLTASVEHDDNKTLRRTDPISATGVVVDVGAALGWQTDTTNVVLTPRLRSGRYDKERDLLNDDNLYLDLASSASTERARYGLNGNLTLDSVDSSETIAEEEGLTRIRRTVSIDRDRRVLAPSWSYNLTERDTASLSATLSWVNYDQGDGTRSGYVDYKYHVLNASLGHAFTERDTLSGILYFSRYSRDVLNSVTESIGLQVGYEHAFTETLKGSVAAGGVRSEFSSDAGEVPAGSIVRTVTLADGRTVQVPITPSGQLLALAAEADSTEYGQLINASLSQKLELDEWSLSLSRTLNPTGDGVLVSRDELRGNYRRKLSERLVGNVSALAYQDSAPSRAGQAIRPDRDYVRVEVGLAYRLSPYWTVRGLYRYRTETYDLVAGGEDTADSNAVWLSLAWQGEKQATSR